MTNLTQLHEEFQQFILSGQSAINTSIVHTELVSVDTRLAIYRDGYKLRLIESLTTTFPGVYAYLGTEAFNKIAGSYIDAHPSIYRSIRWYGDEFATFLKHYYQKKYSYLSELADFEWHMTLAFDARDCDIVQIADMAMVPHESWGSMKFIMHPSVQRLNYSWNVVALWQTLIHDQDLPKLIVIDDTSPWVLWRTSNLIIKFYSLAVEEAWALDTLINGATFGQLCEGLCQWIKAEEVGMQAASYLKKWIQNGMLIKLSF